MKTLFSFMTILTILFIPIANADEIIYRSNTYPVSPDISLAEARRLSERSIRQEILSEIGVLINAEINVEENNNQTLATLNYSEETVGQIELTVISETYDGNNLTREYQATIDKKEVLNSLSLKDALNDKESSLSKAISEISSQKSAISNLQEENQSLENEIKALKGKLSFLERKVVKDKIYYQKISELNQDVATLQEKVLSRLEREKQLSDAAVERHRSAIARVESAFIPGMNLEELKQISDLQTIVKYISRKTNCSEASVNLLSFSGGKPIQYYGKNYLIHPIDWNKLEGFTFYGATIDQNGIVQSLDYMHYKYLNDCGYGYLIGDFNTYSTYKKAFGNLKHITIETPKLWK